ncbi:MAG: hypothetical protein GX033_06970 [Firmicutes bacterium]|nr:hypothetical protein [Bacillota bacterium]
MHCHRHKRTWFVILLITLLAAALWIGAGKGALIRVLPFLVMLLCPLIHGAMFIILGKSVLQGSRRQQESISQGPLEVMGD